MLFHFKSIALIHDDSVNLQFPKDPIELSIRIIADNLECQSQNQILMRIIETTKETDFSSKLAAKLEGHYEIPAYLVLLFIILLKRRVD